MKRLFLVVFALITFGSIAYADTATILVHPSCEVLSATFSSGGGKSAVQYAKILCKYPDKSNALLLIKKGSVTAALGWGSITRAFMPTAYIIKKSSKVGKYEGEFK